jgi:CSLREA domain-containing protein
VAFTVDTTEDSDLADPDSAACVDAASGKCSLRAAVNAADNLGRPVQIRLAKRAYTLSLGTSLTVANPAGTSIVGHGAAVTSIVAAGSRVVDLTGSTQAGLLFLTSLTLTGGTADQGAGLFLDGQGGGATVVLDDVVVSGNTASTHGGGVYLDADNTLYARDSRIVHNTASQGGGISASYADISLARTRVNANVSVGAYGAGIDSDYGVFSMQGGSIAGNKVGSATQSGTGGGIADSFGVVTLHHVAVNHNAARGGGAGGAVYGNGSLIDIDGGTVSDNHATGAGSNGGAIYASEGTLLDVHGTTMSDNTVADDAGEGVGGGALFIQASGEPTRVLIDSGSVIERSNAGAIYGRTSRSLDLTIADSTLRDNHNDSANGVDGRGCGGAVCVYGDVDPSATLTLTGDKLIGNSSTGTESGGGGGAVGVDVFDTGGLSVLMRGNLFRGNRAGAHGYGGAAMFANAITDTPYTVRLRSNRFLNNRAGTAADSGGGGALAVLNYYITLVDNGSTFTGNRAIGAGAAGGAIYDAGLDPARLVRTTVAGNSAGLGAGDGIGGGIYTDRLQRLTLDQVTLSKNRAASAGGGLYLDGYTWATSITGTTISGNVAGSPGSAGLGGGVYQQNALLVLENSTVAGNKATSTPADDGQGGGVYVATSALASADLALRYSTVSRNVAKQGGGLYLGHLGGTLLGSIVSGNHADAGDAEGDCIATSPTATLQSLGGNIVGQRTCTTAQSPTDRVTKRPGLRRLDANGGPTDTMALIATSPAVAHASFQCPAADQRGHARPRRHCDAGAFELPAKHRARASSARLGTTGQTLRNSARLSW